jgi:cytochrome b
MHGATIEMRALTAAGGAARTATATAEAVVDDTAGRTRVWDHVVRVFHWSLVVSVAGALATGFLAPRWWLDVHVALGTAIAALVIVRLVWGFTGSTYARFSSFVVSPVVALGHVVALVRGRARHYVGHNPVGTMMIVALLVTLSALVATGTIALGGALEQGPLAPFTTYAIGTAAVSWHAAAAWLLLALIAGHVLGIGIESLRSGENLTVAMMHGEKQSPAGAVTATASRARPLLAATIVTATAATIVPAIVALSALAPLGAPAQPLDARYAKECSACHSVHHPSLASAAIWSRIMDGLADHFGDDASLDADVVQGMGRYLAANSANATDTRAANMLRTAASGSLRITDTEGWKSIHASVAPALFKTKAVGGKLNCAACHTDSSSGRFAPWSIALPAERN